MALKGVKPKSKGVLKKPQANLNRKYQNKPLIGNNPNKKKSKRKMRNA